MALVAEKRGSTAYPWAVVVTTGPCAGFQVGPSHRLRRDAETWIATNAHLPWDQVQPVDQAECRVSPDRGATVPRQAGSFVGSRVGRREGGSSPR